MNEQTFNLVEKKNNKYLHIWGVSCGLFILAGVFQSFFEDKLPLMTNIITLSFLSIFIIYSLILMVRSWVIKDYRIVGKVTFRSDNFSIIIGHSEDTFFYRDLKSITVYYHGFQGKAVGYFQSYATTNGAQNELKFRYNEKKYSYKFLITNKYHEKWLRGYIQQIIPAYPQFKYKDDYITSQFFGIPWLYNPIRKIRSRNAMKKSSK